MTKDIEKRKFELLKSMNTIVQALNNEDAYFGSWRYVVPDEADDEDFRDIAKDEDLFVHTVNCFKRIMRNYLRDGIYIGGNELY